MFYIFHQVLDLAFSLRICLPANIHPYILLLDEIVKIASIDNVSGVFAHHHQLVLIDNQLLGDSSKIIIAVEQMTDNITGFERQILKHNVLVATGRKEGGKNEQFKSAPAPVLTKIKLHLPPKGKFRNALVNPHIFIQGQFIGLLKIANEVTQRLFIPG